MHKNLFLVHEMLIYPMTVHPIAVPCTGNVVLFAACMLSLMRGICFLMIQRFEHLSSGHIAFKKCETILDSIFQHISIQISYIIARWSEHQDICFSGVFNHITVVNKHCTGGGSACLLWLIKTMYVFTQNYVCFFSFFGLLVSFTDFL